MTLLIGERPVAQRKATIHIENRQLRDLVHATERAGEIITVDRGSVVKYNISNPEEEPTTLSRLPFNPTTLSYSYDPRPHAPSLIAVGGPKAKVVLLSVPSSGPSSSRQSKPSLEEYADPRSYYYDPELARLTVSPRLMTGDGRAFRALATTAVPQPGNSIINSVAFAPLPTDTSALLSSQSGERRLLVSSNDDTVRIYRTANRSPAGSLFDSLTRVKEEAYAKFDTRMNHASVSPDGRILLSAGDSPFLHLHSLSSLPTSVFPLSSSSSSNNTRPTKPSIYDTSRHPRPIHVIPTSTQYNSNSPWSHTPGDEHNTGEAIFSTAFSADGWKLAAGSQDGIVQVWDVRSLKQRLAIFTTSAPPSTHRSLIEHPDGNVNPHHHCPCQGKLWGVRSLRFSPSSSLGRLGNYSDNRELLVFSQHQSTIHFIDARTFDTSPESRQSLFLPSILHQYPRSSYLEPAKKPTVTAVKRGKKRKRDELSSDDEEAERKRREPVQEDIPGAPQTVDHVAGLTGMYLPPIEELLQPVPTTSNNGADTSIEPRSLDVRNNSMQASLRPASPSPLAPSADGDADQWRSHGTFGPPVAEEATRRDDSIIRRAEEVMESSGQLARRLRRVNTQLQDLINDDSAGTSRASTSRSTNSLRPRAMAGLGTSSTLAPNPPTGLYRRYSPLLLGGRGNSSVSQALGSYRRVGNPQSTRDRVEELRRARDRIAAMGTDSDEDIDLDADAGDAATVEDPSFSSDLVRRMMVRWRDHEEGEDAAVDAETRDAAQPSASATAEDDMLWATLGFNAADAAAEIERWALRADELPMEVENAEAETMTNGLESGDETVDVDEELDMLDRLEEQLEEVNAAEERLLLSSMRNEGAATSSNIDQRERDAAQELMGFLHRPLYRHSNRSTTNLPSVSTFASPGHASAVLPSTLAVPASAVFTASPEPMERSPTPPGTWNPFRSENDRASPPLFYDPRSPPPRRVPIARNITPPFRFSTARSFPAHSARNRPFSSRAFGVVPPPPMGEFRCRFGQDSDEEEVEDDDSWEEDRPLDIAGFTFGIPGTESEGTLVVGGSAVGRRTGGRLMRFAIGGEEALGVGEHKGRSTGRTYARGELV